MAWRILAERTNDMAVHAILVPGGDAGRILYFGGYDVYDTHLFDLADEDHARTFNTSASPEGLSPNPHQFDTRRYDIFCCGHAFLEDGRVLIAGGELNRNTVTGLPLSDDEAAAMLPHGHAGMQYGGERQCAIYHPLAEKWEMAEAMNLDPADNPYSGGRWYPTLATLPSGEVLAVGGHPDRNENYLRNGARRHANNTPERYNPTADSWTLLASDPPSDQQITSNFGDAVVAWDYQRTHVLPNGNLLFTSEVRGRNRVYDPRAGHFLSGNSNVIDLPDENFYGRISAEYTSVMLPLLPQESYRARLLLFGGQRAYRIDMGVGAPAWAETPARGWGPEPEDSPERRWVCPVLLPTGEVFLTGGTAANSNDDAVRQAACVMRAETYDPGIDWDNNTYLAGQGTWSLQSTSEGMEVARHYHSVALLQPDGAIWTAGSNGPSPEGGARERRIEIFEPDYFDDQDDRPDVTALARNMNYGQGVECDVVLHAGASVERVAWIRAGSCTHGFNPDQRYIAASWDQTGNPAGPAIRLTVFAPPNANVAPPGYYMLWVIDSAGRPCKLAPMVRISRQKCYITEDIATYSVQEAEALGYPAVFADALFVVFDAFLPDEVEEPQLTFRTLGGDPVSGITYGIGGARYETSAQDIDVAQRIAYPVHITFGSNAPFDLIPDGERFVDIVVEARMAHAFCETRLTLSLEPNPRMRDGHPHYLSTDVRVFSLVPGESRNFTPGLSHPDESASAPFDFISDLVGAYNTWPDGVTDDDHPFNDLPNAQIEDQLALYERNDGGERIYNYAIARVRYTGTAEVAVTGLSVFFRLWTTGWTALAYSDPKSDIRGSYRRKGDGASARPLLGIDGGEVNNVPCFASPRADDMLNQTDPLNWGQDISGTGSENVRYFGAFLDNNDEVKRFVEAPGAATAFPGADKSVQDLMRGPHQCLVAEIHFPPDPIRNGDTPANSDDLSQRNILFDEVPNPGAFGSRVAHHTFEFKPSPAALPLDLPEGISSATAARLHADELAFDWGNLPEDSVVTLYMPQAPRDDVLAYAALRAGPRKLRSAHGNTIQLEPKGVTYVPVSGPSLQNIAGLLTIQLPPSIVKGQRFTVTVRQIDGRRTRILGTTRFDIHVGDDASIGPRLLRKFSVLKHIAAGLSAASRWRPIFERYLDEMGERVRALGTDPDSVAPDPTGNGGKPYPEDPGGPPRPDPDDGKEICRHGRVAELHYDCCGAIEGFVLDDCGTRCFIATDGCVPEETLLKVLRHKLRVTVHLHQAKRDALPAACPWSGRPADPAITCDVMGTRIAFCSTDHRDRVRAAMAALETSEPGRMRDRCPVTGKPADRSAVLRVGERQIALASVALRDKIAEVLNARDRLCRDTAPDHALRIKKIVLHPA